MLVSGTSTTCSVILTLAFFSYGLCATTTVDPTSVDEDEEEEVPSTHVPVFLSKPLSISAMPGDNVTFPCEVDVLGSYATIWRKGEKEVIFANAIPVMNDKHYRRLDNRSLQVRLVRPTDSGDYNCVISSNPLMTLTHTLIVLVPPMITSNLKNHITLNKGQPLNLSCEASGSPPPTVTWKLLDGPLSDGRSIHEGGVLYTAHTTRHQAGTYECLASNGVGKPATHIVKVHVIHAPEVEPYRSWVHAGEDTSAELVCKVRAHPPALVTWRGPNGTPISESEHFRFKTNGADHSLQIRRIRKGDFGEYVCEASNKEGFHSAVITVSGLASSAEFKSDPQGDQPEEYLLKWVTHSHSTVINYILRIKPQKTNDDWTEIHIPADSQQGLLKSQSYAVTGLQPDTSYEAIVIVQNEFGDSQPSRNFIFQTLGTSTVLHKELHPLLQNEAAIHTPSQSPAQPQQHTPDEMKNDEKTGNGASTPVNSKKLSSLLTVIILSVFFWF